MPAEWEPQSGVLLTWPHDDTDWADQLPEVERVYLDLAAAISRREPLLIIHCDQPHRTHIEQLLRQRTIDPGAIHWVEALTNDTWVRDYGPLTIERAGSPLIVNFEFNGWHRRYTSMLDNAVTPILLNSHLCNHVASANPGVILEGGSIEVDGEGTLLTTQRCLLDNNRNPSMAQRDYEACFAAWFGIERTLWLQSGALAGDDTDNHIDMLSRFCGPETIAFMQCEDRADEHYPALSALQAELQSQTTAAGQSYRLLPLPLPAPIYNEQRRRLPASYANFLIINDAVLVPTYHDPADAIALERLQAVFPARELIGIDCRPLIRQNGSLHCIAMQLPQGTLL